VTQIYEGSDENGSAGMLFKAHCLRVDDERDPPGQDGAGICEKNGKLSDSWQNFGCHGWLQERCDPAGEPYELQPSGRVVVHDSASFPFIEHGILKARTEVNYRPEADRSLKPDLALNGMVHFQHQTFHA